MERDLTPEELALLPTAAQEILQLYIDDQLAGMDPSNDFESREQLWRDAAEKFHPFTSQIKSLREASKSVCLTRREYPDALVRSMLKRVSIVDDIDAGLLLVDLMILRLTSQPGHLDFTRNPDREFLRIAHDLNLINTERSIPRGLSSLNGVGIMRSILAGDLEFGPYKE